MASTTPLLFTTTGRGRIVVAIRWDERTDKTNFMDALKQRNHQYDLDVSCFVYDADKTFIDYVGAMAQDHMDHSGTIYHSGDDATGAGGGDDEFISCELSVMPEDAQHLVFVTEIRSNHVFGDVLNPSMRIADGASDKTLHESTMGTKTGDQKTSKACVMARISRDSSSPTGWSLYLIENHPDLSEISDWGAYLTRYI